MTDATENGFNWTDIRERLDRATLGVTDAMRLSPEAAQTVMDERAKHLAQAPTSEFNEKDALEIVSFRLGEETFAVESRCVCEVFYPNAITPVPGSASFLLGVTNLRGEILSILDLREFFGIEKRPVQASVSEDGDQVDDGEQKVSEVIVLGFENAEFAIVADRVEQVSKLKLNAIRPNPPSLTGAAGDFLKGVTDDAIMLLNCDVLFSDERLLINERD